MLNVDLVIQHDFSLFHHFPMQVRPNIAVSTGCCTLTQHKVASILACRPSTARYRIRYCNRKLDGRLYPDRRSRSFDLGNLLGCCKLGWACPKNCKTLFPKLQTPNNPNSNLSSKKTKKYNCIADIMILSMPPTWLCQSSATQPGAKNFQGCC